MAEFLMSKRDDSSPTGWRPVTVVAANVPATVEEWKAIARQGYVGPGRYALVRWDNRREQDLGPGPAEVTDPAV